MSVLRFAASFLWADLEIAHAEEEFFAALAGELGVSSAALPGALALLGSPPDPALVDPTTVPPALAAMVREVALRAIASDGRVMPREMQMFDLLDELLPASVQAPA